VGHGTDDASITPIAGVLSVGDEFAVPEPAAAALLACAAALGMLRRAC
jgi:hypothetical protein